VIAESSILPSGSILDALSASVEVARKTKEVTVHIQDRGLNTCRGSRITIKTPLLLRLAASTASHSRLAY